MNPVEFLRGAIPRQKWLFYAAFRLGAGIMIYFGLIGAAVILFGLIGIPTTLMLFIGLIPFMVFIAVRSSGKVSEKWRPRGDYR